MLLDDFNYDLPEELIAFEPAAQRDGSRLLVVDRTSGALSHQHFSDLTRYLSPGDALVLNNSKVLPARLWARDPKGRELELLLVQQVDSLGFVWECLVRPGRHIKGITKVIIGNRPAVIRRQPVQNFVIEFDPQDGDAMAWILAHGKPPLPPYIKREPTAQDYERYQTVYAKALGSVAAPTAGLHFSPELLTQLRMAGVVVIEVTLHVGYGTFSPIRAEQIEEHQMHSESYEITPTAFAQLQAVKASGKKVVAVGTTALRTLESINQHGLQGSTAIFIYPGYQFQWATGLITNFHLPKSTLYVLVSAFLGMDFTKKAYQTAVSERYRFFSYGDAMAIL